MALYDSSEITLNKTQDNAPEEDKKKPSLWKWLNLAIAVAFIFFGGIFYVFSTAGFVTMLIIPQILSNIILVDLYRKYREDGFKRRRLIRTRIITVILTLGIALPPLINIGFGDIKLMYPVKRLVFAYGVGSKKACLDILPGTVPLDCSDYRMIAQGDFPAQDYHPSLYVWFHTDSEHLDSYAERMGSLGLDKTVNTSKEPVEYAVSGGVVKVSIPDSLPYHVFDWLYRYIDDDLSNAVVYTVSRYGCMLNYDTGLAVFWI